MYHKFCYRSIIENTCLVINVVTRMLYYVTRTAVLR